MKESLQIIIAAIGILIVCTSEARTIRATEMTSAQWSKLKTGPADDLIVEFRQGDELPIHISAKGDFLETAQPGITYINVKKSFWLKLQNNNVEMSLDGAAFKPLKDMLTGKLTADASSDHTDGPINGINLVLEAFIK